MTSAANPFLSPSTLPYGLPPFQEIREEHYAPAFEQGMAEQIAEVEAITGNPEPATFENTVEALERSGALLERVSAVFFNQASSDTTPGVQEIQKDVTPRLAKHADAIHLDAELFARIQAVEAADEEQRWLLKRYLTDFTRAGATLGPQDQARLREINERLSALGTAFQQNLLADTNERAVVVEDVAELDGLSQDAIQGLADQARERGLDGRYLITLVLPTGQPTLAELTNRSLRERIHRASAGRGAANAELIKEIAVLRRERARLLGYENHAEYVLADQTAGTTRAVTEMLDRLVPPAVANARKEQADLEEIAGHPIQPWDWAFYSEKVRKARYDIDSRRMRPYFELNTVLEKGVFNAASRLYGVTFHERPDLYGYHPEVRVFEVRDEDGSPLGLFLGDFHARASKRGGAWMNSLVKQSGLEGTRPVVVNNLNIVKGEPTLMTFDEVNTMFHEFGHALHGLFSDVRHPRFSGTSVPRDFVEYPSQVNEMWATHPEILAEYARHHETGEPMPQDLVDRMLETQKFNQGFATLEYLAATLLDWAWHTAYDGDGDAGEDVEEFERRALREAGVDLPTVPPRYRSTYFAHIWASGYSAGYYSYIWSEVLDADTVEWFNENGGLRRENGDTFRRALLSRGGSVDSMTAFRDFRGRDPEITPLLDRRGLL
ncbi:M3 family metallopeptidase [Microbispora bryophytorum]|uniref:Peptidyl-dipeptidase Dcp n=1 Tax=Microbispora bryophytorum TaxID=1460882 RepID=A0A8H9H2S9_9ACTN|nr:M3 family metallopeptidase [Microbispora bryophytorum]MBD3138036.1 M3 family metallopeptidase [Microbispora bryophytorum]TQS05248.1 M3 family metallopeptidase [Microbispora bryophytorum]GGO22116.1 peptidyl-dipeptidase Dcp [Microbispora bryophytorum]